jgi:hypothetical protein
MGSFSRPRQHGKEERAMQYTSVEDYTTTSGFSAVTAEAAKMNFGDRA